LKRGLRSGDLRRQAVANDPRLNSLPVASQRSRVCAERSANRTLNAAGG
jgi:hypothetical protein